MNVEPARSDLEVLIGMSRREIIGAIGPSNCPEQWSEFGLCDEPENRSTYYFYYLPELWTGGGHTVALYFNDSEECTHFRHYVTQ